MSDDLIYTPEQPVPRKVWVQWADAFVTRNHHWIDRDEFEPKDGLLCESMGFLIHDGDHSIVLAQTINVDSMDNVFTIPKGMVLKMKEVKVGR